MLTYVNNVDFCTSKAIAKLVATWLMLPSIRVEVNVTHVHFPREACGPELPAVGVEHVNEIGILLVENQLRILFFKPWLGRIQSCNSTDFTPSRSHDLPTEMGGKMGTKTVPNDVNLGGFKVQTIDDPDKEFSHGSANADHIGRRLIITVVAVQDH